MATQPATTPEGFRFGEDFELDVRAYELRSAEVPLKLKPIPFELLLFLVERRGELVTREQIVERIWGKGVFLDTDNSINGAISKIRQVLRDDAAQPRFIQTVTGRGYRFIAAVEEIRRAPEPPLDLSSPPVDSLIGKKVSHYRILELLGGGGMGVVYKAEDLKLGRRVALKFLPSELAQDPKAFERLEREARAASALDHRNICSIYELDEHDGQPFIVMQLLEGQTLQEKMEAAAEQGTTLPLAEVLDIALQVTDGLDAAHQKGFIHRDVKPANIFITTRNEARILDFGLAKMTTASEPADDDAVEKKSQPATPMSPSLTRTGIHMGTAFYMSPEQVRGEPLDARTDIFSLGLVLYQMLSGQRAFPGNTTQVVHDGILNSTPAPLREINPNLPPKLVAAVDKCLEKDRERRYQSAVELATSLRDIAQAPQTAPAGSKRLRARTFASIAILVICAGAAIVWLRLRPSRSPAFSNKDTMVLAEFSNSTGDPVFTDTLRQGLAAQLEQTPFLNLLPEPRIRHALELMTKPRNAPLTHELAAGVCQRTGSTATIEGSIALLGSQYVIDLRAINCHNGDLLAENQVTAGSKEQVLKALAVAATNLRRSLGESLASLQKYDTSEQELTTSSLEALNAYTLGRKMFAEKGPSKAIPFFQQAIQMDPKFAMAYSSLGVCYSNLGEGDLAVSNITTAFELRERASLKEQFGIAAIYNFLVTGDLLKAEETSQLWAQTYPLDPIPRDDLGTAYLMRGRYEEALQAFLEEQRLASGGNFTWGSLGMAYLALNRTREARQVANEAVARNIDPVGAHQLLYLADFLEGNQSGMRQDEAWAAGTPGTEATFYDMVSNTKAYYGRRAEAWALAQKSSTALRHDNESEEAAIPLATAALHEAEFGESTSAVQAANAALAVSSSKNVRTLAALAFARAGLVKQAEAMADKLAKENPSNTLLNYYWLPTIRAAAQLRAAHPAKAIELLQPVSGYELGQALPYTIATLYPVYVRGEAYLRLGDGEKAAAEFQKFLDHPGAVLNFPLGALARLGLARAYGLSKQNDKAHQFYQELLTLWKDADSDVPIYQQAKAEYAKLR